MNGQPVWRTDILGEGFESLELRLRDENGEAAAETDTEAPLVATLVRSLPTPLTRWQRFRRGERLLENVDVFYVHGWSDYFFQAEMARFFTDRGARFFALDLRRYGRSLRPGQSHGYVENLHDYDEEIQLAIAEMGQQMPQPAQPYAQTSGRKLLLYGHSTGGLVLSLWAHRNPGIAAGVLLNSPWLALQLSDAVAKALGPVLSLRARFSPHELALPQLDLGFYSRAQREVGSARSLKRVNTAWRPESALPIRVGWLHAVLEGHSQVSEGLSITAPVCVLLSARTQFGLTWRDEMLHADTVLDVEKVARAALKLGDSVTIERIDGALHDVFLSQAQVRDVAYERLERWLRGWVASTSN